MLNRLSLSTTSLRMEVKISKSTGPMGRTDSESRNQQCSQHIKFDQAQLTTMKNRPAHYSSLRNVRFLQGRGRMHSVLRCTEKGFSITCNGVSPCDKTPYRLLCKQNLSVKPLSTDIRIRIDSTFFHITKTTDDGVSSSVYKSCSHSINRFEESIRFTVYGFFTIIRCFSEVVF